MKRVLITAVVAFLGIASVSAQAVPGMINGDLTVTPNAGTATGEYLRQFDIDNGVESFTVMVLFVTGDPAVTLVPPSGTSPQDSETVVRFPNGIAFKRQGIPGRWTLKIANVPSKDAFAVKVFSNMLKPELEVLSPSAGVSDSTGTLPLRLRFSNLTAAHKVDILASEDADSASGVQIATTTVAADGVVDLVADLRSLPQGDYYLVAKIDMGDAPSLPVKFPGSVHLQYRETLLPPINLIVAGTPEGLLQASWEFPQKAQVSKCSVVLTHSDGKLETLNLGTGQSVLLKDFTPGDSVGFQVLVEDANGQTAASDVRTVTFAAPVQVVNKPVLLQKTLKIEYLLGTEYPVVNLAMQPNFTRTGGASDYVKIVSNIPQSIGMRQDGQDWALTLNAEKTRYAPLDGETSFQMFFNIPANMPVGTYTIPIDLINLGDSRQKDSCTLTLVVKYPPVTITSATPNTWSSGPRPEITVAGTGFIQGSRAFVDDIEEPILSLTIAEIKLSANPTVLANGKHTLKIVGPGGSASADLTVQPPSYFLYVQKSRTEAALGETASFWVGVKPVESFTGSVPFHIVTKPAGWVVSTDKATVSVNDFVRIDAQVPAKTAIGAYTIVVGDDRGSSINLSVEVVDHPIVPTLSSLSSPSGIPGQAIQIFGFGFGTTPGQLKIGNQVLSPTAWTAQAISFVIPANAKSGALTVTSSAGTVSSPVYFLVMDAGFSIIPDHLSYQKQPGDSFSLNLVLTGLLKPVQLQVVSSDPKISATLKNTSVTPPGGTALQVAIDGNTPNGIYTLTIKGQSDSFQNEKAIQITVGNAFDLPIAPIPAGKQGVPFFYQLISQNGTAPVSFSMIDGQLPSGLSLTKDGKIQGIPALSGSYAMEVKAVDADGHNRTAKYAIFIDENVWNLGGGDDGRSWFMPGAGPADGRIAWTMQADGAAKAILSGANKIFSLVTTGIVARDPVTGAVSYRIAGSFSDVIYRRSRLAAIDSASVLHVFDSSTGSELWKRESVKSVYNVDSLLIVQSGSDVLQLDLNDGHLISKDAGVFDGQFYQWNGVVIRLRSGKLEKNASTGWVPLVDKLTALVTTAAFDANGAAIALASGKVLQLDQVGVTVRQLAIPDPAKLVLGTDWIAAFGSAGFQVFSRSTGQVLSTIAGRSCDQMAGVDDRLFTLSEGRLHAWNIYSGSEIWATPSNYKSFLLRATKLYALTTDGILQQFNAPDNLQAPVSTLTVVPADPDGRDGWYISKPHLTLSASDRETFVKQLYWNKSGVEVNDYAGPIDLDDGSYQIRYGSVDSKNLREVEHLFSIKVDSTRPVSSYILRGTATKDPYYWQPVAVSLKATDIGSGLAGTEYRLNGSPWAAYDGREFRFEQEGRYTLTVRSYDLAGGYETPQERSFIVDFSPPVVGLEWKQHRDLAQAFLFADDACSGVDKIEYRIDGGAIQTYVSPIDLSSGTTWKLSYHAIDKAGHDSGWKQETIRLHDDHDRHLLEDPDYFDNKPGRSLVPNAQAGMEIFKGRKGDHFKVLPAEVQGAIYLENLESDGRYNGSSLVTFKTTDDVAVYVLHDAESATVLSGYDKIRDYPAGQLSSSYFRKGATLFRHLFPRHSQVTIPGAALPVNGGDAIFVSDLPWDGLTITQPRPGESLVAGRQYTFASTMADDISNPQWNYRLDNARPVVISDPAKGLTIPYSPDGTRIEVHLRAIYQKRPVEAFGFWLIKNQEGILFQGLNEHGTVTVGEAFDPAGVVVAPDGTLQGQYPVSYRLTMNGKLVAQGTGPFSLTKPGLYQLMATATGDNSRAINQKITLIALPKGSWTHARHNDHDRQHGTYHDDKGKDKDVDWELWKKDDNWEIKVPNGSYEVRLVIGPDKAFSVYNAFLNSYSGATMSREAGRLYGMRFQLTVTDGKLKLRASDNFPLVRLDYRPIDPITRPSFVEEGILKGLE